MAERNIFQVIKRDPAAGYNADDVLAELKRTRSRMANSNPELSKWASQIIKDIEADPHVIDRHAQAYATLAQQERKEREKALRDKGKMIVTGGVISQPQLDQLAAAYKGIFTPDEILRIIGARVQGKRQFKWSPPPGYDAISEISPTIMGNINRDLEKVKKASLYDVLSLPSSATTADIRAAIEREYNAASMMSVSNPLKVPLTNIIGHCKSLLLEPAQRRSYDKTVGNAAFAPVRDAIAAIATGTRVIDGNQLASMLHTCTTGGMSRDEALYKIYHEADSRGITVIESTGGTGSTATNGCRYCGAVTADKRATSCASCGMPLAVTCPKCGRVSSNPAENYCPTAGCNFHLGGMSAARDYLKQARQALATGDLTGANASLQLAVDAWPGMAGLKDVKRDIDRLKGDANKVKADIAELVKNKKYYAAMALLPRLGGADAALEREVRDKVAAADAIVARATAERDVNRRIDLYIQAVQIASDCSAATAGLASTPLQPPQALTATVTGSLIKVSWAPFSSANMRVTVLRKAGGPPTSATDGTIVARDVNADSVTDTTAESGEAYFYGAYVVLPQPTNGQAKTRPYTEGGRKSPLAVTGAPVLVTADIDPSQNVLTVTATSITVACKLPKGAKGLEITPADGGAPQRSRGATFTLSGLTTDRTYKYRIATIYIDATGREHRSAGVSVSLTPTSPPDPVELRLSDSPTSARLQWTAPAAGQTVLIFWSQGEPFAQHRGDSISPNAMSQARLAVNGTSCTVNKDFNGVRYFLPVTVKGAIGVAGDQVEVRSLIKPEGVTVSRSAGTLDVSWQWGKIDHVRVTLITGRKEVKDIIRKGDKVAPHCSFTIDDNLQSARVEVCGVVGKDCSEPFVRDITIRRLEVDYISLKQKKFLGLLKNSEFRITLQVGSPLPCDLNVYVGIDHAPLNVQSLTPHTVIRAAYVPPGPPVTIPIDVPQSRGADQVFVLLQPADPGADLIINPATRKV